MFPSATMAPSVNTFSIVPYFPPDAIFDLTRQFLADNNTRKVNLGQGTYRDGSGQPWILPCVQASKKRLETQNHEYLPILGLASFRKAACELLLGESSGALKNGKVKPYARNLVTRLMKEAPGSFKSSPFWYRSASSGRSLSKAPYRAIQSRLRQRANLVKPPPSLQLNRV